MTLETRTQKFCLWRPFLWRIGLRQDKTALKSVEPGQIILSTVETLKSKTVLSAKKVDNTKMKFSLKLPDIHF